MAQTTLNFPNVNISAQVGDIIYYTTNGGSPANNCTGCTAL